MTAFFLPYPDKSLWPNGRAHWAAKNRAFQKHKSWAFAALRAARIKAGAGRVDWSVIFYPKTRNAVDDDNARASLKAYQDGIALALGIDDKLFNAPTVTFGEPVKGGLVRVQIVPA